MPDGVSSQNLCAAPDLFKRGLFSFRGWNDGAREPRAAHLSAVLTPLPLGEGTGVSAQFEIETLGPTFVKHGFHQNRSRRKELLSAPAPNTTRSAD